jgi:hypothetical protein
MPLNQPTPDRQDPGRLPAPDAASAASRSAGSTDRQLEKSVSWSGREWLRWLWYRLRFAHADVDYASRRLFELQAPWTADPQWHRKTDQSLAPGQADTAGRSGSAGR